MKPSDPNAAIAPEPARHAGGRDHAARDAVDLALGVARASGRAVEAARRGAAGSSAARVGLCQQAVRRSERRGEPLQVSILDVDSIVDVVARRHSGES
jgi:hypothetical protein